MKPDVILIAENLPNQSDLNRQGFDGYAQWCNGFHDKLKALLKRGTFTARPTLWRVWATSYFSKGLFASHTNNAVNYCESHDETSVSYEVSTNPILDNGPAQDRKGRSIFASMVALGQPMLYIGQQGLNVANQDSTVRTGIVRWTKTVSTNGRAG